MHPATIKILFDTLGWLGALVFLVSYFLLIIKKWKATSVVFHFSNIMGGVLLTASALYDLSFPSAFINLAWAFIALYGLYSDHLKNS